MYTTGSAKICGQNREKGSLEPGKLGDFTVLGQDPFEVEAMSISEIPVLLTVSGGEEV